MGAASDPVRAANPIASALLFAAVAAAPFPFGSTDPAVIAVWCIVLGLALAAASIRGLRKRQLALLCIVFVVIAAYGLVLHEQLADHPWTGAAPHPIWREAEKLLNTPIVPSVSIAHGQPFFALGAPIAAMLSLVCSATVCADRQRAQQLLRIMAWSGCGYALLGIFFFMIEPTKLLWRDKTAYLGSLTGTFVNRNTAAIYFGACSTVCLLLFLQRIRSFRSAGSLRDIMAFASLDREFRRHLLLDFSRFLVCFAAMLMTGSRAGVVFSMVGMIVAFAGLFWRRIGRRRSLLAAVAVAACIALVILQTVGSGVGERFNQSGLGDPARLEAYRSTLRIIDDHPWLGTGLGTFPLGFPAYRSDETPIYGIWDRAHDTLLEIAAEGGLPLMGVVAAAWIVILAVLLKGIRSRRRDLVVPVAAFSVAVISILHAAIDFSLQIPGYAIVAFALFGAGLAQSFGRHEPPKSKQKIRQNRDSGGL